MAKEHFASFEKVFFFLQLDIHQVGILNIGLADP
jgi:hypothetical protein